MSETQWRDELRTMPLEHHVTADHPGHYDHLPPTAHVVREESIASEPEKEARCIGKADVQTDNHA